jgi:hypothetical protein
MSIPKNSQKTKVIFDPAYINQIPEEQIIKMFEIMSKSFNSLEIEIRHSDTETEDKTEKVKKTMQKFMNDPSRHRNEEEIQEILREEGMIS